MTDQNDVPVGGGPAGACAATKAGHWAALAAVDAISDEAVSEANLWADDRRVMAPFGTRFAAINRFTTWVGAHEVDVPGSAGTTSTNRWVTRKTALRTSGHWSLLIELYRVNEQSKALRARRDAHPDSPAGFDTWRAERDAFVNGYMPWAVHYRSTDDD